MVKLIALLTPLYVTLFWGLIFLLQKKSSTNTSHVLAQFMFTASLLYACHCVYFLEYYHIYAFVESIYILALLLLYPLFYRYILSLSSAATGWSGYIYHFLPAIILSILSLAFTFFMSPEERITYVKEVLIERNLKHLNLNLAAGLKGGVLLVGRITFIAQTVVYLLLGIKKANLHNKKVSEYYSNTEGRRMNWIRDLSIVYLFVSVLAVFLSIVGRSYFTHHEILLIIPSVIFSTTYFILGYNGNKQLAISEDILISENLNVEFDEIDIDAEMNLKKALIQLFETDKIYRHSDLRITMVSESLQTNRTYISRLINKEFGMNFNEFVNQYRVLEAETLLKSDDHFSYKLEYIAEKVGFGSSNSFTRAFKEYKGVTPGQFRNRAEKKFTYS